MQAANYRNLSEERFKALAVPEYSAVAFSLHANKSSWEIVYGLGNAILGITGLAIGAKVSDSLKAHGYGETLSAFLLFGTAAVVYGLLLLPAIPVGKWLEGYRRVTFVNEGMYFVTRNLGKRYDCLIIPWAKVAQLDFRSGEFSSLQSDDAFPHKIAFEVGRGKDKKREVTSCGEALILAQHEGKVPRSFRINS
jgi:hypothetical protein